MMMDAWWFNSTQCENEILQPDFFTPRTHAGLYAEGLRVKFPLQISITAIANDSSIYERQITIHKPETENEEYVFHISLDSGVLIATVFAESLRVLPEYIKISIVSDESTYLQTIPCEYATLSGKMTDFCNAPFPAALMLHRVSFGGSIGVWSNKDGEYAVTVPKGIYNAFFCDDKTYGVASLENWSWHMIVDCDEEHNFKIGNGEVYSLNTWSDNGGFSTLFIFFRPMVLHKALHPSHYQVKLHNREFAVLDICPELDIKHITVTINGYCLENISLQKIYLTGGMQAMPAYILQVQREPKAAGYSAGGKQTLIIEYDVTEENGNVARSQGRTQFFYHNAHMLLIK